MAKSEKTWESKITSEEKLWHYNCLDCVYTFEAAQELEKLPGKMGLVEPAAFQQRLFHAVLATMLRGVQIDTKRRNALIMEVTEEVAKRERFLIDVLGHPLNPRSPKQMHQLFYGDLRQPIQLKRGKKGEPSRPSLDDEALQKLSRREPLLKPLINAIADIRTLGIFLSHFLTAPLDTDGRMRCAYNIGGSESGKSAPKTYRLSSSENAFGSGANLQNVPSEKSKSLGKAAARGGIAGLGDPYSYPNIRSMFTPDPGYCFFDGDLDRADLQVVVWEADDPMLKAALHQGADIHLMNAFVLQGKEPPPLDELVETHPKYGDHRGPLKHAREFAKVFCHATNYGGGARTVAQHTGRTVHEVDKAQRLWFGAHPGIHEWHKRVEDQVRRRRYVENKFGYRWYVFDRIDNILPEALAWVPQCLTLDHEVLTRKGWKTIADVQCEEEIAVWGALGEVHFECPRSWSFGETPELFHLPETNTVCTRNHRVPYFTPGKAALCTRPVTELPKTARVPRTGKYSGRISTDFTWIRYIAAFQADGHYDAGRDAIQFEFTKEQKIARLEETLVELDVPFTKTRVRRDATLFYIPKGRHKLAPNLKYFGPWLLNLNGACLDYLLAELEFWDGWRSKQGELWYSSSIRANCEWVATIAALRGKRARWMSDDCRSAKPNYRITIAPNKGKLTAVTVKPEKLSTPVKVGCPTVSTGYFLVRRGNEISVTGNSTVSIVINKIWVNIHENLPDVFVNLQVHDSLAGQFPTQSSKAVYKDYPALIKEQARIVVPYEDPLIIPFGLKTSEVSWGDCR